MGHEERVIAVREEPNLHLEFYQRDVTDGMRSPWKLPVDVVSKSFQEVVKVAQKIENTMQPVIGLGFHSSSLEDVNHDALWLALLNEVRQPGAHAPNCSVIDCDGYVERKRGRLCIEMSLMEKRAKLNAQLFCAHIRWRSRCAKGMCSVDSECTQASPNQRRHF